MEFLHKKINLIVKVLIGLYKLELHVSGSIMDAYQIRYKYQAQTEVVYTCISLVIIVRPSQPYFI